MRRMLLRTPPGPPPGCQAQFSIYDFGWNALRCTRLWQL